MFKLKLIVIVVVTIMSVIFAFQNMHITYIQFVIGSPIEIRVISLFFMGIAIGVIGMASFRLIIEMKKSKKLKKVKDKKL